MPMFGSAEVGFSDRSAAHKTGPAPTVWLVTALAVIGLSIALAFQWRSTLSTADDHRSNLVGLELLESRVAMSRVQFDELNLRVLEVQDLVDRAEVDEAAVARIATIATELERLRLLSDGTGPRAGEARQLLDVLEQWGPSSPDPDPYELYDGALIAHLDGAPRPADPPSTFDALTETMFLDQAFTLTLHEASIAHFNLVQPAASPAMMDLVSESTPILIESGGMLGFDSREPLRDAWLSTEFARIHDGATLSEVGDIVASTELWSVDQWVQEWDSDELTEPPVDFKVLVPETQAATLAVRNLLDARLDAAFDREQAAVATIERRSNLFLAGLAISALLAMALLYRFSRSASGRSRALDELVNNDPLTGAGNRNLLNHRTVGLLADPRLDHHLVVTIDIDRFKVVNDTYGHGVGDELLVHLANGLRAITESFPAGESTVIRLGGDEFLISLHSVGPIDVDRFRTELDEFRLRRFTTAAGMHTELEFSYGLVVATGSPILSDLMDASDLAAYEEKAARRASRSSIERPQIMDISRTS